MINSTFYQNNRSNSHYLGKWYARATHSQTLGLEDLSAHMASHNCPFSKGTIKGVLSDMVVCIKEQVLQGNAVKIEDLAIFSLGIQSKPADSIAAFNAKENIANYFLRARATGQFTKAQLKLVATISEMGTYKAEDKADSEKKN